MVSVSRDMRAYSSADKNIDVYPLEDLINNRDATLNAMLDEVEGRTTNSPRCREGAHHFGGCDPAKEESHLSLWENGRVARAFHK